MSEQSPDSKPPTPPPGTALVRVGRPTVLDHHAVMRAVCERIANGELVQDAAKAEGTAASTIRRWAGEDEELRALYARARVDQAHALAETVVTLADGAAKEPTKEKVLAARLQVDSRRWLASKIAPKVFGDKYIIEGGEEPIIFRLVHE